MRPRVCIFAIAGVCSIMIARVLHMVARNSRVLPYFLLNAPFLDSGGVGVLYGGIYLMLRISKICKSKRHRYPVTFNKVLYDCRTSRDT